MLSSLCQPFIRSKSISLDASAFPRTWAQVFLDVDQWRRGHTQSHSMSCEHSKILAIAAFFRVETVSSCVDGWQWHLLWARIRSTWSSRFVTDRAPRTPAYTNMSKVKSSMATQIGSPVTEMQKKKRMVMSQAGPCKYAGSECTRTFTRSLRSIRTYFGMTGFWWMLQTVQQSLIWLHLYVQCGPAGWTQLRGRPGKNGHSPKFRVPEVVLNWLCELFFLPQSVHIIEISK